MRWLTLLGFWGVVGLGVGCSSAPAPEPEVPTEVPKAEPQPIDQVEAGPVDSVPAPRELFGVARLNNPQLMTELISDWMNVPFPIKSLLQKELPELHQVLRYDVPVDFAIALDPEAFSEPKFVAALSVAVSDYQATLDQLRSSGHALERISRTMQLVMLKGDQPCVVARANGPTAARFICSDSRKDLDVLAPYMATTMPTENYGSDQLFVELRAEPVRERFGKKAGWLKVGVPVLLREVATGNGRLDAAVADATRAAVNELLAVIPDLDRIVLRAKGTEGREALDVHFGLVLAGQKSWTAQTLALRAADAAPAPDIYWQLPADAQRATFVSPNSHGERLQPLIDGLAELMEGALEHYELDDKPVREVVTKFRKLSTAKGPWVTAEGSAGDGKQVSASADQLAAAAGLAGYSIQATTDDQGAVAELCEALIDAYDDAGWRKTLKDHPVLQEATSLPRITKRAAPASMGLPKGATLYQLDLSKHLAEELAAKFPKDRKPQSLGPVRVSFIIAQKDGQSWFGVGVDQDLLASKLAAAIGGKAPNLSTQPALASLRTNAALGAGFFTLAAIVDRVAQYASAETGNVAARQQFLLAMPNAGKTPITVSLTGKEQGPEVWLSMHVPRAAMEDAAAGAVAVAAEVGGKF